MTFPDDFSFGVATSAYQIEGAAGADGRGPSIWDTFCRVPGAVAGGATGDVACDHYHRWRGDVDLLVDLGVQHYRFSVAWPRVLPTGAGAVEPRGLDFYDRLVDALGDAGIRPVLTLYHWDLPQALQDAGGWAVRDTAQRFADYALVVYERLGDRVAEWTTLNEPWVSAFLGHYTGDHAPGARDAGLALRAMHHLLLGHGLATQALRAAGAQRLSIVLNLTPVYADGAGADDAVRRVDGLANRIFLDPVLRGGYPADVVDDLRPVSDFSFVVDGDSATLAAPIDLLGVNYYTPARVAVGPDEVSAGPYPGLRRARLAPPRPPLTAMGWEQHPDGLRALLVRLARDYPGVPLLVTENGMAADDVVGSDGTVPDADRISFLDAHLRACLAAIEQGADLRGYTAWSLLDNFEWARGYAKRFGLVYVDYPTQARIPKASARWYAGVTRARVLPAG